MNKTILLMIFLNLFSLAFGKDFTQTVSESMSFPLVNNYTNKSEVHKGILYDLGEILADELHAKYVFHTIPRKRVDAEILKGDADISCFSSPKWTEDPNLFFWSTPVLSQIEYTVTLKDKKPPVDLKDFKEKKIGLIFGYHYAKLNELFKNNELARIDKNSPEELFQLVESGLDVMITSKDEIEGYFFRHPNERNLFAISKTPFSVVETQCMISKKSNWTKQEIDNAIKKLIEKGKITELIKKYKMK